MEDELLPEPGDTKGPNFMLIDDGRPVPVTARVEAGSVRIAPADLPGAIGWTLKPQGLCRGEQCVPTARRTGFLDAAGVDLAVLAELLDRPIAIAVDAGAAYFGTSAGRRREQLGSLEAPDFTLRDLDGTEHSLSEHRGRKVCLVAFSSWCGCRYDLPGWQDVQADLAPSGFTILGIALDRAADDIRPFVDAAKATFPVLVDPEHRVADLYAMSNVPTSVWIDEQGRIVRPPDVAFSTDTFKAVHGVDPEPQLAALRHWVKEGRPPLAADEVREQQVLPTHDEQLARAEFGLARYLLEAGNPDAAERHFVRAEQLAPLDFTIRRGSMPLRGRDPFGADFVELYDEWVAAGRPYYKLTPPAGPG